MPSTVQPFLVTRDLDRLTVFYRELLGAEVTQRVPADGPTFFLGPRIGDSDLGLVAEADSPTGPQRMLLAVLVADVDALLLRVAELGGTAPDPAQDMPWGHRVAHVQDPDGNTLNLTQQL